MNKPIPYGRQNITESDIAAIVETLHSDFLTQGPKVGEFEKDFAAYIGCKYAVAVANGTAALHLAAMANDVVPGQKVITTPITFSASANCVRYCGGEILFADIDRSSFTIDINQVEDLFKKNRSIKGVIPVDFAGNPVDLESLKQVTDKYGAWILEDACHAPGGYFTDSKGDKAKLREWQFCFPGHFFFSPGKTYCYR